MSARTRGLLQTGQEDPTVLVVVVLVILIGIGYLVARAAVDRFTGAHREHATYHLLAEDGTLALVETGTPSPGTPVELDADDMRRLIEAVEARNEMRLHTVELPGGEEVAFEDHDVDEIVPKAIVVEDSRGMLRIGVSGLVDARPPLDDAVTGDLVEVFEAVLDDA